MPPDRNNLECAAHSLKGHIMVQKAKRHFVKDYEDSLFELED